MDDRYECWEKGGQGTQYPWHGECGACGACGPLTYRLGLDLFVCRQCNETPGLGGILVDRLVAEVRRGRKDEDRRKT